MSELGQQLKEARLQKGLSLDDVQEMTKIRKRYLEAIESGDYKVLPGSFYVRAFIKTYAETVGLNPEELLEGHKKDVPAAEQEATMEPVMQKRSSRPQAERNNKWLSIVLPWTFLALILVLIYIYWVPNLNQADDSNEPSTEQTDNQPSTTTPEPDAGEDAEDPGSEVGGGDPNGEENPDATAPEEGTGQEEEPVDEEPVEDVPVTVTESGTSGNITIFDVTGGSAEEPITVEIKASGESWLEMYNGQNSSGEQLVSGLTAAGDNHSFELTSEGMYIKSGYAPATEITVNGQVVTDGKTTNRILLQLAEGENTGSTQDGTNSDSEPGSEDGQ
ncbi:helix-turn-helix domain-containing protein [Paenibacillus urinalis]|uniref:Helix-turn-helix domain-containing protein n=1 Tax=Paenibacillus urinalis TaxID=521520 RepID=A0AAX3N476_9BACL|nr:RodZ family helix-turn-helix domain-containing protein [Paenibacillus urinalis]WDH84551.1 helix-turn-helix domain-containing protein [Paenibacillus urinalis]